MNDTGLKRYCVFDTETGGVGAEAAQKWSIIQLGACIYYDGVLPGVDQSFSVVIKEACQVYDPEALRITGFTEERIHNEGLMPSEAVMKFVLWLKRNFPVDEKIMLMGHNVGYDVSFLQRLFRKAGVLSFYDDIFDYRTIDTASIARAIIEAGLYPPVKDPTKSLLDHFDCAPSKPHDALSDAIATGKLYQRLIGIIGRHNPVPSWSPIWEDRQSYLGNRLRKRY